MVVNPDIFQVILLDKGRSDNTNIEVEIGHEKIRSTSSVKLLGVHIDDKLNFNEHINKICKSAGNQLNSLIRLKPFSGLKEKEVLEALYILITIRLYGCSHKKSLDKIESLHNKRALRFFLKDYVSSYEQLF